jgi:hypothetical protein
LTSGEADKSPEGWTRRLHLASGEAERVREREIGSNLFLINFGG